ncbi:MAG: DUF2520 domain-containing protein [Alistipes sp.]|jgi:predicted short-subunit dehydrogenase-like oxidoreductase (DUF2520 family)|nr:DUF2520 domain-containing protein [Alistipes sp.]
MHTLRIVIIGNGSVAEGLAREFGEAGVGGDAWLVQQWARKTHSPEELAEADLYVLAVSDGAVGEVSGTLPFAAGSVVAHTAGCVPLEGISSRIVHRAVLYPLQSFTRGRRQADFRRTPFFIEGATPHALSTVRRAAGTISDSVAEMSSERRARIHLAGAFANNFSNAMLSLAGQIASDAGETFDALRPIVAETFAKALDMPSPEDAQTGAAQRGDRTIQARHLEILAETHPELITMYKEISDRIWRISKRN